MTWVEVGGTGRGSRIGKSGHRDIGGWERRGLPLIHTDDTDRKRQRRQNPFTAKDAEDAKENDDMGTPWKSRHWKSDERPKLMVKLLIPIGRNSEIEQKYPHNGHLR
jgi:hypothetical protein